MSTILYEECYCLFQAVNFVVSLLMILNDDVKQLIFQDNPKDILSYLYLQSDLATPFVPNRGP